MVKEIPFEGEAVSRFRVYPTAMDNILFTFCVLGKKEGGWAERTFVPGINETHYWELVSKGNTLCVYDRVSGNTHHIDSESLMQGIRMWIESGEGTITNGSIDIRYDETRADHIVQYAIFGRVKYE